jgi:hypothetical protein
MTQSPNQFNQTPEKGSLDLSFHSSVVSAIVAAAQVSALTQAQAVKVADVAGGILPVISLSAETVETSGFVVRNFKDVEYAAGDRLEIAMAGSVMYMEAGAAIARGANVEVESTGDKVITAAGTNPSVGWAYDKAATDGDLIRVFIKDAITS